MKITCKTCTHFVPGKGCDTTYPMTKCSGNILIDCDLYNSTNKLKAIRTEKGITQKELARLSGVPIRVIRSYEQEQRSINNSQAVTVIRLAVALGCEILDLVD